MNIRLALLVSLTSAVVSCGDDLPPTVAQVAGLEVAVYPSPARIVVTAPDGTVLFDGLPGGAVGQQPPHVAAAVRTAEASWDFQFGSFRIDELPSSEGWRGIARFADLRSDSTGIAFDLIDAKGRAAGTGQLSGDMHLTLTLEASEGNRMSVAFDCRADEHFLGLGGQSWDVDHRGQTVPLWVQEDGIGKAESDDYFAPPLPWFVSGRRHSTHTPMPMYVSSRGYALALDTQYRSIFSLCSEAEDVVRLEAWEGRIALHLFHGPSPLQSIEKMTAWVGRPTLPPAFAFAPWIDAIYGSANVRDVAERLRASNVAASVLWTEDWRGAVEGNLGYVLEEDWRVDRDLYPDFSELTQSLHEQGYKLLIYHNAFLDESADVYPEAIANGYTIENADGSPYLFTGVKFRETTLLDLSNPEARTWAQSVYRESLELGADGYMADYGEWLPVDATLASGEDPLAAHNAYPVEWHRLHKDLLDELYAEDGIERLFFVRSAYLGSQPLVSVVWAGDQQTDFSLGDGLPSVIPMGIGLGVTGFPYYGHDIAGYMSQLTIPVTEELWYRWVTLGALSPVMRTHHGRAARENWRWDTDAAATAHMARWTQLHLKLFPYLYGLAERAAATGEPMFRPLALTFPDFEPGWTATDQYMLGDRIVVAPIVEQGATSRTVLLPDSERFFPLLGGAAVTGTVTAAAAKEDIPVFVRAGSVLVMLPDGVDTVVDAAATPAVTTLADVSDDRDVWLYPDGSSSWTEAGGTLTYAWEATTMARAPTAADFNGQPIELVRAEGFLTMNVTGNGTLTFEGGGTLTIAGGADQRELTVRLYLP